MGVRGTRTSNSSSVLALREARQGTHREPSRWRQERSARRPGARTRARRAPGARRTRRAARAQAARPRPPAPPSDDRTCEHVDRLTITSILLYKAIVVPCSQARPAEQNNYPPNQLLNELKPTAHMSFFANNTTHARTFTKAAGNTYSSTVLVFLYCTVLSSI